MKQYEYVVEFRSTGSIGISEIPRYLNEKGQDGWELVHILDSVTNGTGVVLGRDYVFKREILKS